MKQLTIQDWGLCIGGIIEAKSNGGIYKLSGICITKELLFLNDKSDFSETMHNFKPIIRTVDQITEKEKAQIFNISIWDSEINYNNVKNIEIETYSITFEWEDPERISFGNFFRERRYFSIEQQDYLTRIGIDIRGWIAQGLAIKYDPENHGELI